MNDAFGQTLGAAPPDQSVRLADVFTAERIQVSADAKSTKRVLEILATLLTKGHKYDIEKVTVFRVLKERERLGSTCVGNGVALPHGRLHDLPCAVGALVRLTDPIEFGSCDEDQVDIACGLLVPINCADVHLQLLSRLASGFRQADLRRRLTSASDAAQMHAVLASCDDAPPFSRMG